MRAYLKTLVKKAPVPLARWGELAYNFVPPSLRYGRPWREAVALLRESENWSQRQLISYQQQRLEKLINHCYTNVPFYRNMFQHHGLTPRDIQSIDDLKKLPLLTKEMIKKNKNDFVAENYSALDLDPAHTSGSTGTPLDFYMDKTTRPMDRALVERHLNWLGYKPGDKSAFFKGLPLIDPRRICQYFPGSKELRISFHKVDNERLKIIVDELKRFQPDFINAWPSCLYILARWMDRNNRSIKPPKYIVTSSENHYPHMKEYVENIFKSKVIDWYGQEESVAVAAQCKLAQGYHIQMEMCLIELLPYKEDTCEIIGTCLHNFAMPFIRYKTGDLAVKGHSECPCGRKSPTLEKIIGREADFVITPEGNIVSPLILHFALYYLDEIKEAQIIQEDLDSLKILISPWTKISQETKDRLAAELLLRLESPSMRLTILEVEEIPKKQSAYKNPFLISRVRLDNHRI